LKGSAPAPGAVFRALAENLSHQEVSSVRVNTARTVLAAGAGIAK